MIGARKHAEHGGKLPTGRYGRHMQVRSNRGRWFRQRLGASQRTEPHALRTPLALLLMSLIIITAVWCWLSSPVNLERASIDTATKLECVSYAPFREKQSPWSSSIVIDRAQIEEDLSELSQISKCIRIYSVENGLDQAPVLASKFGLKVFLGIWLGRDQAKNARLVDTTLSVIDRNPDVIEAVIVGSEVLLRGEMAPSELRKYIRAVKARVSIPVSYSDAWEFWLYYPEVSDDVDFITVHMLPYWENFPVRAEDAAAHVDDIRRRLMATFPAKEILIGEAGWPSRGRMRDGALPSRINQARFLSDLLERSRRENFRVNLFEAFDEPWKRQWEGTVGGSWGLLDGTTRKPKYRFGEAVSNFPFWRLQIGFGLALCAAVFGSALLAYRRRPLSSEPVPWTAVAISAGLSGSLLGLTAEGAFYGSYGLKGSVIQLSMLTVAIAAPLLCANALALGHTLPRLGDLIDVREHKLTLQSKVLGLTLLAITLIALESALGLVFEPQRRDFPFAGLTMAVLPFWTLSLVSRLKSGPQTIAEILFACLFALAALYILFNEGLQNWQAQWTSAVFFMLAATLWRPRTAIVFKAELLSKKDAELRPTACPSIRKPEP